eukprot:TRINITY_DN1013_c0_g1_i3.p1 TRINITY_DN1013_c0_g1~~TRINITY_DN1013_c0_g1_i3.p1  ORF type:complete len:225 (-),score=56.80 TRINITY_DN1013_c0_g1_i3:339-1013(-)
MTNSAALEQERMRGGRMYKYLSDKGERERLELEALEEENARLRREVEKRLKTISSLGPALPLPELTPEQKKRRWAYFKHQAILFLLSFSVITVFGSLLYMAKIHPINDISTHPDSLPLFTEAFQGESTHYPPHFSSVQKEVYPHVAKLGKIKFWRSDLVTGKPHKSNSREREENGKWLFGKVVEVSTNATDWEVIETKWEELKLYIVAKTSVLFFHDDVIIEIR